eukprot:scaffold52537_cov58-Phaeocystis_antarctica.AAC.5
MGWRSVAGHRRSDSRVSAAAHPDGVPVHHLDRSLSLWCALGRLSRYQGHEQGDERHQERPAPSKRTDVCLRKQCMVIIIACRNEELAFLG